MTNPYSAPGATLNQDGSEDDTYLPQIWSFSGRIGRLRYIGYSALVGFLILLVMGLAVALAGGLSRGGGGAFAVVILLVLQLAMFIAQFVYTRRRLNDLDLTGWISLLLPIPLLGFLLWLYLLFAPGTDGYNRWGTKPAPNPPYMWLVALVFPATIVTIGILAAIAMPAYQQYVQRAKAAQHSTQMVPQAAPQDADSTR